MRPILLATCATFLAAPTFAQGTSEACAAAAGEPSLVWYSSQDPSRNEAAAEAFTAANPEIEIEHFRLSTGKLATRYATERDAGVIYADVISLADPVFIVQGNADGWFAPLSKEEIPALAGFDDAWLENNAVTTSLSMLGFAYNTDQAGDAAPVSWEDILKPEYKGRIILGDPRNVPSYMALFRILKDKLGDDYLTRLAEQEPVLVPSVVPATQQLAAGEVAIVLPNVMTVVRVLKEEGAPIDFTAPELTTGNEFETMISQGADSPNAAVCFLSFLLSDEGQIAYNGLTSVSPKQAYDETAPMPGDYVDPDIASIGDDAPEIVKLLKLE